MDKEHTRNAYINYYISYMYRDERGGGLQSLYRLYGYSMPVHLGRIAIMISITNQNGCCPHYSDLWLSGHIASIHLPRHPACRPFCLVLFLTAFILWCSQHRKRCDKTGARWSKSSGCDRSAVSGRAGGVNRLPGTCRPREKGWDVPSLVFDVDEDKRICVIPQISEVRVVHLVG